MKKRMKMVDAIQRSLREKIRTMRHSKEGEEERENNPGNNRCFVEALEESNNDLVDDIPPYFPGAMELGGKMILNPDFVSVLEREFFWMITGEVASESAEIYSDLFEFGAMWRLQLRETTSNEDEDEDSGGYVVSLQLAQTAPYDINLRCSVDIFIPGHKGATQQHFGVSWNRGEHGFRALSKLSSALFASDAAVTIGVKLTPGGAAAGGASTEVMEEFEDYDCIR